MCAASEPVPTDSPVRLFGRGTAVLTAVVLLGIAGLAWWLADRHGRADRLVAQHALTGIAEMKAGQLAGWLRERRGDAAVVGSSLEVRRLLAAPQDPAARAGALAQFHEYQRAFEYEFIAVYDARGGLVLATSEEAIRQYNCLPAHVATALQADGPVSTDLHRGAAARPIHFSVFCRIRREADPASPVVGAVVLVVNPTRFLFPFVQRWPLPSPSGETLLLGRDGDAVVCLNEPRHRPGVALELRLPLGRTELPEVQAAQGADSLLQGPDYRGVPVLAVARPIPETPWVMLAKVDRAEVDGPIVQDRVRLVGIAALSALALLLGGGLVLRQQRLRLLQRELARRQQIEAALRESQERLDRIIAAAQDAIIIIDPAGRISLWNEAAVRIFGHAREEALGRELHHFLAPDRFQSAAIHGLAAFHRTGAGAAVGQVSEYVGRRKDGEEFPLELSVAPLQLGGAWHAVGILRDITTRKQAEESLRQSRELLRLVVDTIPQAVFWKDRESRYLGCNRTFAALAGLEDPARIVGLNDFDLPWQREESEAYRADDRAVLASNQPRLHIIEPQLAADGVQRWIDTSKAPLRDAAGQAFGVLGVYDDISEKKRLEESLRARNEELIRFSYTVSHDLKSPLVTIQTFLGFLEQDMVKGDAGRVQADFGYIRRASVKMSDLLDELLALSRIGRKMNEPEDVAFGELVQAALDAVAGRIAAGRVQVHVAPAPVVLHGDRVRLVEILQNLLDNAAKFMGDQADPRIEVGAEETGREWVLYVRDNGLGIDPRHQHKLFGLFEKLHPDLPGTGMGLALVKRIVEVHGGRIWAESRGPGLGATFRFTLRGTRRALSETSPTHAERTSD